MTKDYSTLAKQTTQKLKGILFRALNLNKSKWINAECWSIYGNAVCVSSELSVERRQKSHWRWIMHIWRSRFLRKVDNIWSGSGHKLIKFRVACRASPLRPRRVNQMEVKRGIFGFLGHSQVRKGYYKINVGTTSLSSSKHFCLLSFLCWIKYQSSQRKKTFGPL